MRKVLHVFTKLDQGGIEHVIINLMRNMDPNQVEFHFAILSGKKGVLDDYITQLGGKIHYFTSGDNSFRNVRSNLSRIIQEYGPFCAIHSHVYFFSGFILKVAKKNGIPVRIAHAHDTYKGEKQSFVRKIYEKVMRHEINRYATYKFGVSTEACQHVFGKIDDHTFIVNNGINLEQYKFDEDLRVAKRKELNISDKDKVLINIGRFEDQKDHQYLIEVFDKLVNDDPTYYLILVGSGSLKSQIQLYVSKKGIDNRVLFLENRSDVNELLMAADIFVMPSKYEGLPVVMIEAQATGIPCVVSDRITNEAFILPNVEVLSKDKKSLWIQTIKNTPLQRYTTPDKLLSDAGFNIKKIAQFVQKKYYA